MTSDATRAVADALAELVAVLDATASAEGPDRHLAARAAVNIRATLASVAAAADASSLRSAFEAASYDTSERGMFEWAWSPAMEETLRVHAERIGRALDRADRRVRRNPRAL